MPCYQENLISVEFGGQSVELLRAIGAKEIRSGVYRVGGIVIDTTAGMATGEQGAINAVKRQYSAAAVRQAAKAKGWTLQAKASAGNRKFLAVKY